MFGVDITIFYIKLPIQTIKILIISNTEKAPQRNPRLIVKDGKQVELVRNRVKRNKDGDRIAKLVSAKTNYSHASAGDIVFVNITKDRCSKGTNNVQIMKGKYKVRVKTPNNSGVEVVIDEVRASVKQANITYIHRNDGYDYRFASNDSVLLPNSVI